LGVLKAGGTYLPTDPNYPAERIYYILDDSKSVILLTNLSLNNDIKFKGKVINIGDINLDSYNTENTQKCNNISRNRFNEETIKIFIDIFIEILGLC
jgi:non-ribosomal peptide synthetase component F